jgi:hypothetical protein
MFTLPSTSYGRLFYNYTSDSKYDYAITSSQRFYPYSSPIISSITFVPANNYTGKVSISYIAYATNGYSYSGTVSITVGTLSTKVSNISYTTNDDEPVQIKVNDINEAILEASGENVDYVMFTLPSASYGALYYDYFGPDNYDSKVKAKEEYYRASAPRISDVSYVPNSGESGQVKISYTAYTNSGLSLEGVINITVKKTSSSSNRPSTTRPTSSQNEPSSWAKAEVESLMGRDVIPSALLSRYNELITRDEFTALLVNTYEYARGAYIAKNKPGFKDIESSRYRSQIEKGYDLGIIIGYSDTIFAPDDNLTREQAAKILCTTVAAINDMSSITTSFKLEYSDKSSVSVWAVVFVAYATEQGLMIGAGNNQFKPLDNLTREEAMLLAERMIVKYAPE